MWKATVGKPTAKSLLRIGESFFECGFFSVFCEKKSKGCDHEAYEDAQKVNRYKYMSQSATA